MSSPTPDYSALGYKDIIVTLDEFGVALIIMNRAKQRNSYTEVLTDQLLSAFDLLDRDDRVRVIVFSAEHTAPAFCSGADLSGGWSVLWNSGDTAREGEQAHRDTGGRISIAIYRCRKITISAVNGHAAGVGMTAMQLPFDFRFAWADAKMTFPFTRRGINAEATSTYLLPRLLGHSRATALLLSGDTISPTSPLIKDLYHAILPTRDAVLPHALSFARDLALKTSVPAVAYTKALLQHPGDSIEENHLLDSRAIFFLSHSKDAEEGLVSFKERREPRFKDTLGKNSHEAWFPWWRSLNINHRAAKL